MGSKPCIKECCNMVLYLKTTFCNSRELISFKYIYLLLMKRARLIESRWYSRGLIKDFLLFLTSYHQLNILFSFLNFRVFKIIIVNLVKHLVYGIHDEKTR